MLLKTSLNENSFLFISKNDTWYKFKFISISLFQNVDPPTHSYYSELLMRFSTIYRFCKNRKCVQTGAGDEMGGGGIDLNSNMTC